MAIGIPGKNNEIENFKKFIELPNFVSEKHHFYYGAPWCIGFEQFNYVKKNGLKPHHKILDFGCGSLRAGIHLIRYLKTNNYTGVDIDNDSLQAGVNYELVINGLTNKEPTILHSDKFDWNRYAGQFDYVLVFSVLGHIRTAYGKKEPVILLDYYVVR